MGEGAGSVCVVQAVDNYKGQSRHHLPFQENELILVLERYPSGWWTGQNKNGQKGLVPSTFMRSFTVAPPPDMLLAELEVLQRMVAPKAVEQLHPSQPQAALDKGAVNTLSEDEAAVIRLMEQMEFSTLQLGAARKRLMEAVEEFERDASQLKGAGGSPFNDCDTSLPGDELCESSAPSFKGVLDGGVLDDIMFMLDDVVRKRCLVQDASDTRICGYLKKQSLCEKHAERYCELLRERLELCHADVKEAEAELSDLSVKVREAGSVCRLERDRLLQRISLRDAKMRALCAHWADRAKEAKRRYIELKATMLTPDPAGDGKQEEMRLRQAVADGRTAYIRAEDELQHWRAEANRIREILGQRADLQELSRALHQTA
ncbi:Variant SH3 domain [Trypanosoma vivax]|nr:Variant SH3 domain [Trypanosoma vivax]